MSIGERSTKKFVFLVQSTKVVLNSLFVSKLESQLKNVELFAVICLSLCRLCSLSEQEDV